MKEIQQDKPLVADAYQALFRWYADVGRHHLPWRQTKDAYAIWLSEIMLQQTQVSTVLARFYHPFLARFPTIANLANASEEQVLKYWQGLGYYNRARNLHDSAKIIINQYDGVFPKDVESIKALPGIGQSTAHAIAAFAFNQPYPICDANLKRILARLCAATNPTNADYWNMAWQMLDADNPHAYNQAMMDIGASICTPKNPKCNSCPLAIICAGKKNPQSYPQKSTRRAIPTRHYHWLVIENATGQIAMWRRSGRHLGGLYGFWPIPDEGQAPHEKAQKLGIVTQSYSHYQLHATLWRLDVSFWHNQLTSPPKGLDALSLQWLALNEAQSLPLSGADEKAIRLISGVSNPSESGLRHAHG